MQSLGKSASIPNEINAFIEKHVHEKRDGNGYIRYVNVYRSFTKFYYPPKYSTPRALSDTVKLRDLLSFYYHETKINFTNA